MQAQTELGDLPRFARDIAFLTASGPASHRDAAPADHCLLRPFSGLLDVRMGRGRVPRLDLSYLTLEPLVARGLHRSTGSVGDARSAETLSDEPATPDHDADHRGERPEPRVRDVIHVDREGHQLTGTEWRGDAFQTEGPARRHLDLESGRPGDRSGSSGAAPQATDRDLDTRTSTTARSGSPDTTAESGSVETVTDPEQEAVVPRLEPGEAVTPDTTWPDPDDVPPGRSDDATVERLRDRTALGPTDAPERTVIDQSRSSVDGDDRIDRPTSGPIPSDDTRPRVIDDITPPRMVTRREANQSSHRETDVTGRGSPGDASAHTSHRPTTETAGSEARQAVSQGSVRPDESGLAGPDTPGDGPRMTVQQTARSGDQTSRAGTGGESDSAPASGPRGAGDRSSIDPTAGRDAQLDAVIDASTNPESQLVDRLYRALQEREAIERRRRGGR